MFGAANLGRRAVNHGVRSFLAVFNYIRFELTFILVFLQEMRSSDLMYTSDIVKKVDLLIFRIQFVLNLLESIKVSLWELLYVALPDGLYKKIMIEFEKDFNNG